MRTPSVRVAIVGGGPVGATLACYLAQAGVSVAVVEKTQPVAFRAAIIDQRVYALSPASSALLAYVGAWQGVLNRRACPYDQMKVWDAASGGDVAFDAIDVAADALGYIVENQVVQSALYERAVALDDLLWLSAAEVVSCVAEDKSMALSLSDGAILRAELVIAADGAQSSLRAMFGMSSQSLDYGQKAVVATVRTALSHENTAWQRFLPGGPLAFLPLSDGQCSIVWSLPEAEAARIVELNDQQFMIELQAAFDSRMGDVVSCGERSLFPLRRMHAERYINHRFALIGDAAHVIHPLAGQGVNLGLADVACLGRLILDACNAKRDIGGQALLRRYERERRSENTVVMSAMDVIKNLFAAQAKPIVAARSLGLRVVERSPWLKRQFMRRAMGNLLD